MLSREEAAMFAGAVILVLILLVGLLVAGVLRRLVRDESDVERRLGAPGSHTVAYLVPNGVDSADLRAALQLNGFTSITSDSGAHHCLIVECAEGDRAGVRRVIESVHETAYDGRELDLHPVLFEDEKEHKTAE
jgi:hypothetical protein